MGTCSTCATITTCSSGFDNAEEGQFLARVCKRCVVQPGSASACRCDYLYIAYGAEQRTSRRELKHLAAAKLSSSSKQVKANANAPPRAHRYNHHHPQQTSSYLTRCIPPGCRHHGAIYGPSVIFAGRRKAADSSISTAAAVISIPATVFRHPTFAALLLIDRSTSARPTSTHHRHCALLALHIHPA